MTSLLQTLRRVLLVLIPATGAFIAGGCDPSDPDPTDPAYDVPILRSLLLSTTTIDTDSIFVGNDRLPDDVIRIGIAASVELVAATGGATIHADVRSSSGKRFGTTSSFNDMGSPPDVSASDGRYTGTITFDVERARTGRYSVQVFAMDANALASNTLTGSLDLIRANLPPVLSSLVADTLISQSGGNTTLQLRVTATDPNGLIDVQRVWFDAYRPDGSASSGNPFIMLDDGNTGGISGDVTAGDGIYGLTVAFQGAALGTYRFSFAATDRFRDTSNVIDHFLTVVP